MNLIIYLNIINIYICFIECAAIDNKEVEESQSALENDDRFGGDMVEFIPPKGVLRKGQTIQSRLWPKGVIPYQFASSFDIFETDYMEKCMEQISSKTCLKFKKRTSERDYVNIMKGSGCYSYVGKHGGGQDVSIGRGCMYRGTIIHELMHAIGFYHEHMRSDRDTYLDIHKANIKPGMENNFQVVPRSMNQLYTDFDCESIMCYSSTSFSKNGKPTMTAKDGCILKEPYDKNKLTKDDVTSVNKMYNCL